MSKKESKKVASKRSSPVCVEGFKTSVLTSTISSKKHCSVRLECSVIRRHYNLIPTYSFFLPNKINFMIIKKLQTPQSRGKT